MLKLRGVPLNDKIAVIHVETFPVESRSHRCFVRCLYIDVFCCDLESDLVKGAKNSKLNY